MVFCLSYSFDLDGISGVLFGVFFWFRWRTWCFGWRILLIGIVLVGALGILVGILGVFVIGYLLYEHENLVFRMVYLVLSS